MGRPKKPKVDDYSRDIIVQSGGKDVALSDIIETAYLGLGDLTNIEIRDCIMTPPVEYSDDPLSEFLYYMSKPEYFYFTCKYLFNIILPPIQVVILQELYRTKFPILLQTRGGGKTWLLALYSLLRALFEQGTKIVYVGSGFRQSKLLFSAAESIYNAAPVFKHLVGQDKYQGPKRDIDQAVFHVGESQMIAIPVGTGDKIRGIRSNITIADEFASMSEDIFEVVIKGFSSVASNPMDKVKKAAAYKYLKSQGVDVDEFVEMLSAGMGNQTIIAGTASYAFNHFYKYWTRYKKIIESGGDKYKLEEIFNGEVPENFNYKDYSIIRIPFDSMPEGFMDVDIIAQSKATSHSSAYLMEYACIFATDSAGFFKRGLIESCVCKKPIQIGEQSIQFEAVTQGNRGSTYIYGIDPASENDNFAIVILEVCQDHRRIVYSWTMTRQRLKERIKGGANKNFYSYCSRKILDLLKIFPSDHIGIDGQGGGIQIIEALHDPAVLQDKEPPLWEYMREGENDPYFWEEKNKQTDGQHGLHIIHKVQFANDKFTHEANHGLRKDLESKIILFPRFDSASIGLAIEEDKVLCREYDTLEDVVMEIEEMKDELATVELVQTPTGKDRWDTPRVKTMGNKIARMRKDRYTALIIANMIARVATTAIPQAFNYEAMGGYVGQKIDPNSPEGPLYTGPQYLTSKIGNYYGCGVVRSK